MGTLIHCQCGAQITIETPLSRWDIVCPRCSRPIRIRGPRDDDRIESESTAPGDPAADDVGTGLTLVDVIPASERDARPSPVERPAKSERAAACRHCGNRLERFARICIQCGTERATGHRLVTRDDASMDGRYQLVDTLVPPLSWIVWFGVLPIGSEAFGLRGPWVTRIIAVATMVISLIFIVQSFTGDPNLHEWKDYFLWTGDREPGAKQLRRLYQFGPLGNREAFESALDYLISEKLDVEGAPSDGAPPAFVAQSIYQTDDSMILAAHRMLPPSQRCTGVFEWHQLFTSAALHGGVFHLLFNMVFLMVFGSRVNALIGNVKMAVVYPLLAVSSGLTQVWSAQGDSSTAVVGASGAIMGLAGMYLVFFPRHPVHLVAWLRWFGTGAALELHYKFFALSGFWAVFSYVLLDIVPIVIGARDGVAHWSHLGGFAAGVVIGLILLSSRLVDGRGDGVRWPRAISAPLL